MKAVFDLGEVLRGAVEEKALPLPSLLLAPAQWQALGAALARGTEVRFLGLFVAAERVNAMVLADDGPRILAMALEGGAYPALSPALPEAGWFERLARDLTGVAAEGAADERPAILHRGDAAAWPDVAAPEGEGQYQIGEGPVSGLIGLPLHRRLTVAGDAVASVEHRLGYVHRGIVALMQGRTPRAAAPLAARIAGWATVAHSLAIAHAVEAALEVTVEHSIERLRKAMVAAERTLAALSALGDVAEMLGFDGLATRCAEARRRVEQANAAAFFHPLMMDAIGPGGLAASPENGAFEAIAAALAQAETVLGRAGSFRVRLASGAEAGRVAGMVRAGIEAARAARDVFQSVRGAEMESAALPSGVSGTGIGVAARLSGAVYHWVMLLEGRIAGVFVIDPSGAVLHELESEAVGMTPEAVRLRAASMAVSVGGVDL